MLTIKNVRTLEGKTIQLSIPSSQEFFLDAEVSSERKNVLDRLFQIAAQHALVVSVKLGNSEKAMDVLLELTEKYNTEIAFMDLSTPVGKCARGQKKRTDGLWSDNIDRTFPKRRRIPLERYPGQYY
ncbi:MAG: hypothetical protein LLG04_02255 [Parachlamydia sp.]|nr:hypothetical protein [Parachlamydia sp.]